MYTDFPACETGSGVNQLKDSSFIHVVFVFILCSYSHHNCKFSLACLCFGQTPLCRGLWNGIRLFSKLNLASDTQNAGLWENPNWDPPKILLGTSIFRFSGDLAMQLVSIVICDFTRHTMHWLRCIIYSLVWFWYVVHPEPRLSTVSGAIYNSNNFWVKLRLSVGFYTGVHNCWCCVQVLVAIGFDMQGLMTFDLCCVQVLMAIGVDMHLR